MSTVQDPPLQFSHRNSPDAAAADIFSHHKALSTTRQLGELYSYIFSTSVDIFFLDLDLDQWRRLMAARSALGFRVIRFAVHERLFSGSCKAQRFQRGPALAAHRGCRVDGQQARQDSKRQNMPLLAPLWPFPLACQITASQIPKHIKVCYQSSKGRVWRSKIPRAVSFQGRRHGRVCCFGQYVDAIEGQHACTIRHVAAPLPMAGGLIGLRDPREIALRVTWSNGVTPVWRSSTRIIGKTFRAEDGRWFAGV